MKKTIAFLRWFTIAVLLQVILIPLSYILFPISYIFRSKLRHYVYNKKGIIKYLSIILWIFLDDEEFHRQGHDYGEPWWRRAKNLEIDTTWKRFKVAYMWNVLRNPAWNQYTLIKPKQGTKVEVSHKGKLFQKNKKVSIFELAILKWVDKDGNYSDNKGDFISKEHSIFGELFLWYKVDKRLYWRYSFVKKMFGRWIELQVGTNDIRYTIRFKIKKGKIYEQ